MRSACGGGSALLETRGCGAILLFASVGDKRNGTVAWSIVGGVARPPRVVILRGGESKVQRRMRRGPRALCFVVATVRQATRGPVSVVSLRQVEGAVAAVWRQRFSHGGSLSGAIPSASFGSLSIQGHI